MKNDTAHTVSMLIATLVILAVAVGFWGTIFYVGWHFIEKYW